MKSEKGLALQKFVVLIVVLMMITGVTVYVALDSELFVQPEQVQTIDQNTNTVNN